MIISIHQPDYIPYWGYFYKIARCDKFVFLDDCQFSNDNMHHWNRIKTSQGECRLKIPVEQHLGMQINSVRTKDELKWKQKHLRTLEMNYSRAPFFKEIFPQFRDLLEQDYISIADLNIALNKYICVGFGFVPTFYNSSELHINSTNENRVIDICRVLEGNEYISGNGARAYQIEENFAEKGITLTYTDFQPFEYTQLWGEFVPNMSILDYIFNCGFKVPKWIQERL